MESPSTLHQLRVYSFQPQNQPTRYNLHTMSNLTIRLIDNLYWVMSETQKICSFKNYEVAVMYIDHLERHHNYE
jgi:hypothetical protein